MIHLSQVVGILGGIILAIGGFLISYGNHRIASIWILFIGIVLVALSGATYLHAEALSEVINTKPTTNIKPDSDPFPSMESFASRLRALDGEFATQDAFIRAAAGARVSWTGRVERVVAPEDKSIVVLEMRSTNQATHSASCSAIFTSDFRDRLFALRRNDTVTITGNIRRPSPIPDIDADGITLHTDP